VAPLTIAAGSSTGELAITVDKSMAQGALKDDLVLQGSPPGASATATMNLPLFVRGKRGEFDTTFAPGGVYENIEKKYYSIPIVVSQSDGKILIGAWIDGVWHTNDRGSVGWSEVIRLNADGSVDSTFRAPFIQTASGGDVYGLTAYPDGRVVTITLDYIIRYTATGTPDVTFNKIGSVSTDSLISAGKNSFYPEDVVAVGQDDSIYVGGSAKVSNNGPGTKYAFLQIPANGQGNTRGMHGCSGAWDKTNESQYITKLSLLSTGALVFAGTGTVKGLSTSRDGVGVGRYNQPTSCALDPNYGNKGIWYSKAWHHLEDAVFEADGSVDLLVSNGVTPEVYSIVRINKNGNLEAKVDLPLYAASGITRVPDGRYLVAGGHEQPVGKNSMAVACYTSDLKPDTSIGKQGVAIMPVSTTLSDYGSERKIGLRAVYTPDGSRTVVVGRIDSHLVVARIWN